MSDTDWPGRPGHGPLAGIRVLDLSRVLAGPFATMQLADLGADVIKVEEPGRGDETRHWGPPFAPDGTASYFLAVNHNKRSLALDLGDPEGAAVAQRLAGVADVVVDNFLPGRLERFGLDRASLVRHNPAVVTATISGFGTDNAYAGRPGFDFLAQAMGGLMAITGQAGGPPTRVGVAITDIVTGLFAAVGILAVLEERRHTGVGRQVDVALIDAQLASLANIAAGWLNAGVEPDRFGNQHPSIAPYETLRTKDHPIAFAVGTDRQFAALTAALGLSVDDDPRFTTNARRINHRAEMVRLLEERLVRRGREHWLPIMHAAGVPAAPVNSVAEAFTDPVLRERMVVEIDGVAQVRSPLRLDGAPLEVTGAPPMLGRHNDEILTGMGVTDELPGADGSALP